MQLIKDSMLIGYVCGNTIDRAFMPAVLAALNYDRMNRRSIMGVAYEPGPVIDDNRNMLTRTMLESSAEWFWLLDTDTAPAPTAPYILMDAAKEKGVKIMAGLQFSFLKGACKAVWYDKWDENGQAVTIGGFRFGELYKLVACGMGCCLIHREVFEAFLKVPEWAGDSWTWFGRDQIGSAGATEHLGEDITFCRRAARLSFEIWGHAGVEAKHAKRWEIGFDEFKILYQGNYGDVRDDQ